MRRRRPSRCRRRLRRWPPAEGSVLNPYAPTRPFVEAWACPALGGLGWRTHRFSHDRVWIRDEPDCLGPWSIFMQHLPARAGGMGCSPSAWGSTAPNVGLVLHLRSCRPAPRVTCRSRPGGKREWAAAPVPGSCCRSGRSHQAWVFGRFAASMRQLTDDVQEQSDPPGSWPQQRSGAWMAVAEGSTCRRADLLPAVVSFVPPCGRL